MEKYLLDMTGLPEESYEYINGYYDGREDKYEAMDWLVYILDKIPGMIKIYEENNIDNAILLDTLSDVGIWAKNCKRDTGSWGLLSNGYGWLENHVNGRLFKIGRLQFIPKLWNWNIRVFRNKASGNIIALTGSKAEDYAGDGHYNGVNGIHDANGFKGSSREYECGGKTCLEGTFLSPYGYAVREPICIDLSEWAEILCEGVPVFDLHIQQDDKFTPEVCLDSLKKITQFADKYYKMLIKTALGEKYTDNYDKPFTAFVCGSWLLDIQYEKLLPPTSNIVKFLREFYLFPEHSDENTAFWRVYGAEQIDVKNLPPELLKTSMQRAIADFTINGGHMRANKGFMLVDCLDKYGTEPYRRMYDSSMI